MHSIENCRAFSTSDSVVSERDMKRMIASLVLLTFTLLGVSCQKEKTPAVRNQPYPPGHFAQQIKRLESANVTNDVNAAMLDSDRRFLVCVTTGGGVPGVPHWNEELYKRYGTRILDGTGDMILNNEQKEFKATAHAYAEAYNKLLWSKTEGKE
jgi:hypothetical protein